MSNKFPSTLLVSIKDKLSKIKELGDVGKDLEDEIRKADLDLLDKINKTQAAFDTFAGAAGNGPFVPLLPNPLIAGEPSLGTPHPTNDTYRSAALLVNTSTNTNGVWSSAVTMNDCAAGQAHAGAKAALCMCLIVKVVAQPILNVEAATGYTLSDTSAGTNYFKYYGLYPQGAGLTAFGPLLIHLDANGQFKWCSTISSSLVQIGSAIDYEM